MRLVHFSDLHLGYRQYQRQTAAGINQREADVAQAFRQAVDRTLALAPDLVLIAGDVFHQVRPSNPAIIHAYLQLQRLVTGLGEAPVVMVAGNHDLPRAAETGCILRLFAQVGVHVADRTAERFRFAERGLSVLAVPDVTGERPALLPEPGVRHNVLLLHGEVAGVLPDDAVAGDRATAVWQPEDLRAGWDYIALGHYHVYRQVQANAWYSGSLEYASSNVWGERHEEAAAGLAGKGLIEHDLATGAHRFHPVAPARDVIDLPPLAGRGLGPQELDAAIRDVVEAIPGGLEDRIVRLVVKDVPRHVVRELDHKALREYKRRALHFQLDTRRPELVRPRRGDGAPGGRRQALADLLREKLQARPLEPGLDRARLVALGAQYLREADDVAVPASAAGDDA